MVSVSCFPLSHSGLCKDNIVIRYPCISRYSKIFQIKTYILVMLSCQHINMSRPWWRLQVACPSSHSATLLKTASQTFRGGSLLFRCCLWLALGNVFGDTKQSSLCLLLLGLSMCGKDQVMHQSWLLPAPACGQVSKKSKAPQDLPPPAAAC